VEIAPLEPVPTPTTPPPPETTTSTAPPTTTTTTTTTLPPTSELQLERVTTITGDISPKSVVATGDGLFFAQNMMYRHTVTVYDQDYELVATIPDTVTLNDFGYGDFAGEHQGAPVEAVPTSDGRYVYVSNYRMYGEGYGRAGGDGCDLADWDESFVYRISTAALEIDQVIPVGAVPKFLAITPDDSTVLVSNWCSFDLSVIDAGRGEEIGRVPLGRHPRGIAVTADGTKAYVAVMGSRDIAIVDLADFEVEWLSDIGTSPRHVVLDPSGQRLYATINGDGTVVAINLATSEVTHRTRSGAAPRSMTISDDGLSLYVVNYNSNTVSKIDTTSMEVSQTVDVPDRPIGITFDPSRRELWVASYSGAITVLRETASP
jgi:YVTN family beta-propeller protein